MTTAIDPARILHLDANCAVLDKKAGEAMEGATEGLVDLPRALAARIGSGQTAGGTEFAPTAVHRLDVPVTGCALFARTPAALAFLNSCFAEGKARKLYWAITEMPAEGTTVPDAAELVHYIAVDGRHNKAYAHPEDGPERKKAILRYRTVGKGDRYLFVEIELITGRHHQIRAQLAAIGLRIKGDLKYGARRSENEGGIRLYARALSFPDLDRQGAYIQVTAPLPLRDPLWLAFEQAAAAEKG